MENLAGVIKDNSSQAGRSLIFIDSVSGSELSFKNASGTNYAELFASGSESAGGDTAVALSPSPPIGYIEIHKQKVREVYIDLTGVKVTDRDYLCGGDSSSVGFANMQKFELKGADSIRNTLCYYASSLTNVILHEGLKTIGEEAFGYCTALTNLKLPDSLTSVSEGFCVGCASLAEVYIPGGCLPASDDNLALSVNSNTAVAYTRGITLKGPGAKAWKAALPNRTSRPYRKLILDPEWA